MIPSPPVRWHERARELGRHLAATARRLAPSARLLATTEAHTYAYSVSANCLLASLPFLCLMLWVANHILPAFGHQTEVVQQLVLSYLPAGQTALIRDAWPMARRPSLQLFSVFMLAISSSGVFLPLEVALNSIWGIRCNRPYFANQAVSLVLVAACGAVAYVSVLLAGLGEGAVAHLLPASWTGAIHVLDLCLVQTFAVPATICVFFLVYWWLPNGPVPAAQVFPAALYTGLAGIAFKTVFQWMLPWLDFRAVYGASLSLAVTLLVWGYGGALLLLFGASLSARGAATLPALRLRAARAAASVL